MKLETAEAIKEAADCIGSMDFSIREEYSGRGMFGRSTAALEYGDQNDLMVAVAYAAACIKESECANDAEPQELSVDDFLDEIRKFCHDNMGRDFVVY